jgi:hypothetical protein
VSWLDKFWKDKAQLEARAYVAGKAVAFPRDRYATLIEALEEAIKNGVIRAINPSPEQSNYLLNAARNMAVYAVRDGDASWIRHGLLALAAEGVRYDPRETLIDLCLLNNSADRIGADLSENQAEIERVACREFADLLATFIRRPNEQKSLKAFGYIEVVRAGGFDYKRNW